MIGPGCCPTLPFHQLGDHVTAGTTVALVGEKAIAHHALRLMEQQDAQRAK